MKSLYVFGARLDNPSAWKIQTEMDVALQTNEAYHITTLNPEILLHARTNTPLRTAINAADLNIPDGVGLHLAYWRNRSIMKHRCTGIDLAYMLAREAAARGIGLYLVARADGLSSWTQTASTLQKIHPTLSISGIDVNLAQVHDRAILDQIHCDAREKIVLCNFGAPEQEIFLSTVKNDTMPSIKLLIGVGGAFDYITGKRTRAPQWLRKHGLEWAYRLAHEPHYRAKRVWNAVVVFPLYLIIKQ